MLKCITLVFCVAVVMLPSLVPATPVPFSVGGDNTAASIQATVDAFRAALGDPNNGNAPGPLPSGRREINWDGGGNNSTTTPPVTPFNVFLDSRGAQFTTQGTGLTQAPPSADPVQFPPGGLAGLFNNPTYGTTFSTFSPLRLFAPVGSNITDGLFFLPGTNGTVPATVSGFGAVFTDVDLPDTTQIEYFNDAGNLLFSRFVEPGIGADGSLSFLGVFFDAGEGVARVRITTGNSALGPNDGGGVDVVAMDDFLYGEPQPIPEPSTLALFGIGVVALFGVQRYRKTQRARLG
jgi:PEP-CTERM motif